MGEKAFTDDQFWSKLGWDTCHVILDDSNQPRLKHYWVDDLVPDKPLAFDDGIIRGSGWVMEHEDAGKAFTKYEMVVVLGPVALAAFKRGTGLIDALPSEDDPTWMTVDTTAHRLTIRLD